jgi:hypothetical protein
VLRNDLDVGIQSVDIIEMQFAEDPKPTVFQVNFAQAGFDPKKCDVWRIEARKRSPVIELPFNALTGEAITAWSLEVPCRLDLKPLRVFGNGVPSRATTVLTLRLKGLLEDGKPFVSEGSGVASRKTLMPLASFIIIQAAGTLPRSL